jgi:hypothetical protein
MPLIVTGIMVVESMSAPQPWPPQALTSEGSQYWAQVIEEKHP